MRLRILLFIGLLLPILATSKGSFSPSEPNLCFIENKGQITNPITDEKFDFVLNDPAGVALFIKNAKLQYQFAGKQSADQQLHYYCLEVQLLGANKNAKPEALDATSYYERYFLDKNDQSGTIAHAFLKVRYANVYPGIDWVVYIKDNKPEYDFVVHEGADISKIRMKYVGADELFLNEQGAVHIKNPFGEIIEQKPVAYLKQNHESINATFKLRSNILSFKLNNKPKGTYVIDPQIKWATYFGGGGVSISTVTGICMDSKGYIYISANCPNTSSLCSSGAFQTTISQDVISKFDKYGNRIWTTYYGSPGFYPNSITCDSFDNIYICGASLATNNYPTGYFTTNNAFQMNFGGGNFDAFLVKFDSSGQRKWATYYGGSGDENARAITTDKFGNVYIVLELDSTSGTCSCSMATNGTHQFNYGGGIKDALLAKFDSSGNRVWATYYGGNKVDIPLAITADTFSNVYISGITSSTNNIAFNSAYQNFYASTVTSGSNAFLAKFNFGGNLVWATYYGDTGHTQSRGVTCDINGYPILVGTTSDPHNIASSNAFKQNISGPGDCFVAQFDTAGNRVWSTYWGGNHSDTAYCVTTDKLRNIYVCGITNSDSGVAMAGAYQMNYSSNGDAFISMFKPSGLPIRSTYFGGQGQDLIDAIRAGDSGNIFFCGFTKSLTNIVYGNAFQSNFLGNGADGFIAKLYNDTFVAIQQPFTDTLLCANDSLWVQYITNDTFLNNNTFSIQLSDSSGSFINGSIIGSINATLPGAIHCLIPNAVTGGLHYKMRIIASNPIDTSEDVGKYIRIIKLQNIQTSNNTPFCAGDTLMLFAQSNDTGISFIWTGPAAFSSTLQNPKIFPTSSADSGYYICRSSYLACYSNPDTSLAVIMTITAPQIQFITFPSPLLPGQNTTFTAHISNSGNLNYFNWYLNHQYNISTHDSLFTTILNPGDTLCVVGYSSLPCAIPDSVMACIGISDVSTKSLNNKLLNIYPNPVENELIIEGAQGSTIKVYDVVGRIVYTGSISTPKQTLNTKIWLPGTYFISLQNNAGSLMRKIVK
jgi:hypothetical protein